MGKRNVYTYYFFILVHEDNDDDGKIEKHGDGVTGLKGFV